MEGSACSGQPRIFTYIICIRGHKNIENIKKKGYVSIKTLETAKGKL